MIRDTHREQEITFDTATEEWTCGALALADKSLAALKRAIDRASKERRRVNVAVLYLDYYKIRSVTIVLLREGDRKAEIKVVGEKLQQQVPLSDLYPLSERIKLEAFVAAKKAESAATIKASRLQERLCPITADAVRAQVVRDAGNQS
jgi:hypothetical protein